jgi:hypothetical protein
LAFGFEGIEVVKFEVVCQGWRLVGCEASVVL